MSKTTLYITVCLCYLSAGLAGGAVYAETDTSSGKQLVQQRLLYPQALKALKQGQVTKFNKLKQRMKGYPLYPYLEYAALQRRLSGAQPAEISSFIASYPGTPLARNLNRRWLYALARNGKWRTFLKNYTPNDDTRMGCYYARGLLRTGNKEQAYEQIRGMWLTSKSLPRACDSVIQSLHHDGELSAELVWARIRLAMRTNRTRLARHLNGYLPNEQKFWFQLWRKVRRNPRLEFNDPRNPNELEIARWIREDALVRLARLDAIEAAEKWAQQKDRYAFQDEERGRIERNLALRLLRSQDERAAYWLDSLKLANTDPDVHQWYVISALKDQDWETALAWLERMETDEQHSERWRYWRGRILESLGRLDEARSVFLMNVNQRSFYGFLSADHAGLPYRFTNQPLSFSRDELNSLLDVAAVLRARELFFLNQIVDARREWNFALQQMNQPQLLKAAQLAHQWGWHDRAILTFGQAEYWDDLERRFPLAHYDLVLKQARTNKINPAWAFAVIRQESAFTEDARSHAGALGLMQLLPRTARQLARSLRIRVRGHDDLLNARTNVQLGVGYLKKIQDKFNGNKVLATAAYNAGHWRVRKWLPESSQLPADVWVETVPFTETRDYLKRVLTYTVIYEDRLGKTPSSLLENMPPIPPRVINKTESQAGKPQLAGL